MQNKNRGWVGPGLVGGQGGCERRRGGGGSGRGGGCQGRCERIIESIVNMEKNMWQSGPVGVGGGGL